MTHPFLLSIWLFVILKWHFTVEKKMSCFRTCFRIEASTVLLKGSMEKVESKLKFLALNHLLNFCNMLICPVMAYKIPVGSGVVPRSIFHGLRNHSSYHTLTYLCEILQNPRAFKNVNDAKKKKKLSKLPLFNVFGNQLPIWNKCNCYSTAEL